MNLEDHKQRIVDIANSACDYEYFHVDRCSVDGMQVTLTAAIDGFDADEVCNEFTDADLVYTHNGCSSCGFGSQVVLLIKEL